MISVTGVFPGSSGGDTGYRLITVMSAVRSLLTARCLRNVRSADVFICIRMKMFLIHGSAQLSGRSLHWDGRTKHRNSTISILTQSWSQDTTSCSSGSSGWFSQVCTQWERSRSNMYSFMVLSETSRDARCQSLSATA